MIEPNTKSRLTSVTNTEIQNKVGMSEQQIAELNAGLASIPLGRMLQATEILGPVDLSSLFLQQFDWYLYKAEPA